MKKVKLIYIPLLLSIACVLGVYIGSYFNVSSPFDKSVNIKQKQKLNTLLQLIDKKYVDDVNTDSIVDVAIGNIINDLDPHTVYLPKAELDQENQSMNGSFVGIGISFNKYNDTLTVIRTLANGPSERAGIRSGDKILYANGIALSGSQITSDSVVKLIKGESNTKVKLKIKRKGENNILDYDVVREEVTLRSVDAGFMLNDSMAYFKINRFSKTTFDEFMNYAKAIYAYKPKEVIIDLRNNGGGYLKQAVDIVDQFLEEDTTILYTEDRGNNRTATLATSNTLFKDVNVTILINEKSASASEIIAGAIQDNDRGLIVGRRSFGKGLVQRTMPLGDGSAVRMTIARYYTPTGRSIQRSYDNGREDYYDEYLERYNNGELESADNIEVIDSLKFKTPKGKVVYGGGGIIPDLFIPKNNNDVHVDMSDMFEAGILDRFIFNELEKDRVFYNDIEKEDFISYFVVSDNMLVAFYDYLNSFNININEFKFSKPLIRTFLKATIAQQLYGTDEAYRVIVLDDLMIKQLLQRQMQVAFKD
jgi:carboxyl-terminal processing protease